MENILLLSDGVQKRMEDATYSKNVMDALALHTLNIRKDSASWQTSTQDDYEDGLIFISRVAFDEDDKDFVTFTSITTITEVTSSIKHTPVGDFQTEDDRPAFFIDRDDLE